MNAEGGRFDQANLAQVAAFEGIFAQVLEGIFVFQGELNGRRAVGLVEFLVVLVGVNAVKEDLEILVALGLGRVGAFFEYGLDVLFGLLALPDLAFGRDPRSGAARRRC